MPLVYIDNVVDAIILSMKRPEANGQIFNVADGERVSKREFIDNVIRPLHPRAIVVYVPYWLLYAAVWLQEALLRVIRRPPLLSRYRLISSQKVIAYDHSKLTGCLGWQPCVSAAEAFERIVAFEAAGRPSSQAMI